MVEDLGYLGLRFRDGAARPQVADFLCVEAELLENLFVVLSDFGGAPCGDINNASYLNWTADGRLQLTARAFERDDDVVEAQLRVVYHLLRLTHGAEGDVGFIEHFVPMRHRVLGEDLI